MTDRPIRVLCVDDHAFLVAGLRARFELERDVECVGELESADRLVMEAKRLQPDVVLLDIEMPGPDPFEAVEDLHRALPKVRTVFLSAYVRDHYISAAVNAGAFGYFSKSDDTEEIIDTLSPREQEVLRMIGRGMTRDAIAGALCRSPKTIDGHREKIMEKLDIHDRGELVRFAIREGLAEA
jgi:DNA-binding NarL/FixJ family response regulator